MTPRRNIAFGSARAAWAGPAVALGIAAGIVASSAVAGGVEGRAGSAEPSEDRAKAEASSRDVPLEEARVMISSGQSVTGLLVAEEPGGVRLRVDGRDLFVPESDLVHIERLAPIEERYHERRDRIAAGDTEMRLALAEWLRDRERFALALVEAETALGIDPGNRRARTLAAWLQAQLVLENRTRARREGLDVSRRPTEAEDQVPTPTRRARTDRLPLLTPEQVNLIRVYEVDLNDPPRLTVPRPTMERLFNEFADHPLVPRGADARQALLGSRPERQLELIFRTQARDLYPQIRVMDDPETLEVFRQRIHGRWLVRACASSGCHGGAEAGRLRLAADRPNRTETVYTNFLILERFRLANGEPLLNHQAAETSALLRAGLRRDVSLAAAGVDDAWVHPDVPPTRGRRGWRAIFRGPDDARYEETVAWIRSLYRPRPEYPIDYNAVQFIADRDVDPTADRGSETRGPQEGPFGPIPAASPEVPAVAPDGPDESDR